MTVIKRVLDWKHEIFVEKVDPRIAIYPFFGPIFQPPWGVMSVLLLYVYFITYFGPRFMEKRQPYELKKIMIVYNLTQVLLSSFIFYEGSVAGWGSRYSWTCQPLGREDMAPEDLRMVRACFVYFCCKILDLLDTVFIVLRKNYRQLSFLHTYHHSIMLGGIWIGAAYSPGGHISFVGYINAFVHIIMYSYYMLTAIDPKYKNYIGIKKWITRMQLAQFLAVFLHGAQVFFQPNCNVPKVFITLYMIQAVVMMILFSNFYFRAYIMRKKVA